MKELSGSARTQPRHRVFSCSEEVPNVLHRRVGCPILLEAFGALVLGPLYRASPLKVLTHAESSVRLEQFSATSQSDFTLTNLLFSGLSFTSYARGLVLWCVAPPVLLWVRV
jgi:hypothetical protein